MRRILLIITILLAFITYRKQQNPAAYKIIEDDTWMKKWYNDDLQLQIIEEEKTPEINIANTDECYLFRKPEII